MGHNSMNTPVVMLMNNKGVCTFDFKMLSCFETGIYGDITVLNYMYNSFFKAYDNVLSAVLILSLYSLGGCCSEKY